VTMTKEQAKSGSQARKWPCSILLSDSRGCRAMPDARHSRGLGRGLLPTAALAFFIAPDVIFQFFSGDANQHVQKKSKPETRLRKALSACELRPRKSKARNAAREFGMPSTSLSLRLQIAATHSGGRIGRLAAIAEHVHLTVVCKNLLAPGGGVFVVSRFSFSGGL
jgi:hypothetical protein